MCLLWVIKISYIHLWFEHHSTQGLHQSKWYRRNLFMLHYLNYKECYYAYKNMITLYSTSQEKKWSWQNTLVASHQGNKACQLSYTKTYTTYTFTPDKLNIVRSCGERSFPLHHIQVDLEWLAREDSRRSLHSTTLMGFKGWVDHREWSIVKGRQSVYTPELYDRMLSDLQNNQRGIERWDITPRPLSTGPE